MLRLLSLLVLLASNPAWADRPPSMAPITGGQDSQETRPWMAALLRGDIADPYFAQFCGASLIHPSWALTAAHCVHDAFRGGPTTRPLDLLLDTESLNPGSGLRLGVAQIIIHPGYVPPTTLGEGKEFDNDIALLRLREPVENITPVDLPGRDFGMLAAKPDSESLLLGWGAQGYDEESQRGTAFPIKLKQLRLPVVAPDDCVTVMGASEISANMFCAGRLGSNGDSCIGDSGGPLTFPAGTPSGYVQLGIVSWGLGCGEAGNYGVYTRLGRYSDWITRQVCAPAAIPETPRILALYYLHGGQVHFIYDGAPGLRYRLYYAPSTSLSPIRYLDMGGATAYHGPVPPNQVLKVAVQAYDGPCSSGYSTITQVAGLTP